MFGPEGYPGFGPYFRGFMPPPPPQATVTMPVTEYDKLRDAAKKVDECQDQTRALQSAELARDAARAEYGKLVQHQTLMLSAMRDIVLDSLIETDLLRGGGYELVHSEHNKGRVIFCKGTQTIKDVPLGQCYDPRMVVLSVDDIGVVGEEVKMRVVWTRNGGEQHIHYLKSFDLGLLRNLAAAIHTDCQRYVTRRQKDLKRKKNARNPRR